MTKLHAGGKFGDSGYSNLRIQATTEQPVASPDDKGAFRVVCGFSHMNFDDAIVYPEQQASL